jgi:hypothetical protein
VLAPSDTKGAMIQSQPFWLASLFRPKDEIVMREGGAEGIGQSTFISSGPPGVGKTLTAEGIAEMKELPLYNVC